MVSLYLLIEDTNQRVPLPGASRAIWGFYLWCIADGTVADCGDDAPDGAIEPQSSLEPLGNGAELRPPAVRVQSSWCRVLESGIILNIGLG